MTGFRFAKQHDTTDRHARSVAHSRNFRFDRESFPSVAVSPIVGLTVTVSHPDVSAAGAALSSSARKHSLLTAQSFRKVFGDFLTVDFVSDQSPIVTM